MGRDLVKSCFQWVFKLLRLVIAYSDNGLLLPLCIFTSYSLMKLLEGCIFILPESFVQHLTDVSVWDIKGQNSELWIWVCAENCTQPPAFLSAFKFWIFSVLSNSYFNMIIFLIFKLRYANMPETIKPLHARETSQWYFVIKVNGSDPTSNPSWNEGILLLEIIILPLKHWTFPVTIANVWKFTPVLWRWNFTILTTNICFLWQKWQMFHPGAITQVPMKIPVFTQVLTKGKLEE